MQVHDVDVLGAQALQCRVDAGADARASPVGLPFDAVADLGRQHELAAPVRQMAADALFAQAVSARGVDERDAEVQRAVQQRGHGGLGQRGIADLPGPQAECGDSQTAAAVRA